MDPITVILTALVAGATTGALDGLKDEAKEQVKAAWGKLRDLVSKRFRDTKTDNGEAILAEWQKKPKIYEGALNEKLGEAKAGEDEALLAAANAVHELLAQQGRNSSKYNVSIKDSENIQVGDHNILTSYKYKP